MGEELYPDARRHGIGGWLGSAPSAAVGWTDGPSGVQSEPDKR